MNETFTTCDVLTFGEAMLRLSPPGRARVEQADAFALHVAGSESNVAVALCRMGLRARWLSRLPADGRGRRVTRSLAAHGVDVSPVVWDGDPAARVGLFFVEWGAAPRATSVIYDRAGSSASRLAPGDIGDDLLRSSGTSTSLASRRRCRPPVPPPRFTPWRRRGVWGKPFRST
jgi:2-dehydro-3-deoxygluconokinase